MRISVLQRGVYFLVLLTLASVAVLHFTIPVADKRDDAVASSIPKRQVIHVVTVCPTRNSIHNVVTLVTSIASRRKNPLHFHFLADKSTVSVLSTLFNTWNIPEVSISLYSTEQVQKVILPTTDEETIDESWKAALPSLLPLDVDKVIVLDPDMMILEDIAALWTQFAIMNSRRNAAIGIVAKTPPGQTVQTAIILLDLARLRQLNESPKALTRSEVDDEEGLVETNGALKALVKQHPDGAFTLSARWNVCLMEETEPLARSIQQASEAKIIQMQPAQKQPMNGRQARYLLRLYATSKQLRGNDASFNVSHTVETSTHARLNSRNKPDKCYEIRREGLLRRRTHLFYFHYDYVPVQHDVTLVTQMNIERVKNILESLGKHWKGPMSVSLYLSEDEEQQLISYVLSSSVLMSRTNIAYHVVRNEGVTRLVCASTNSVPFQKYYPINYLRNVALGQVTTSYVYLADADFLPIPNLYDYLRGFLSIGSANEHAKRAYIIPAFETVQSGMAYPGTKRELLSQVQRHILRPFLITVAPESHTATDITRWWSAKQPYKVEYTKKFEPYIVVPRNVQKYDERFVGYGWNKIAHILELYVQGYEFLVLPDVFMIHQQHQPSADARMFNSADVVNGCMSALYKVFVTEIQNKYNVTWLQV